MVHWALWLNGGDWVRFGVVVECGYGERGILIFEDEGGWKSIGFENITFR